jgi:flagellin FlaB
VFSYVVLGAGFFTTQKSQETVHTAVSQASSTMELSGPVTVLASGSAASPIIRNVSFYLQLSAGGQAVDMTKITYTISNMYNQTVIPDVSTTGSGNMIRSYVSANPDNDNLLEPLEMVYVDLYAGPVGITPNQKFVVDIKPDVGASIPITKTAPLGMTTGGYYEVY